MERPVITESLSGSGYIVTFNQNIPDMKIMIHIEEDGIVNVSFPKSDSQDDVIWTTVKDDTVIINAF